MARPPEDRDPSLPAYESAKRRATAATVDDRRDLAAQPDVPPEILYFLAGDVAAEVRLAVAQNPNTPLKADLLLTGDADPAICADLVRKTVARLAPNEETNPPPLDRIVNDILMQIAADPRPSIRALLARATRECRNLPAKVALGLALDREGQVASPMVEHSPVLTDDDLLAVLRSAPPPGVAGSLARRDGLSTRVAAGIVESGDADAIGSLLANQSAQIREETLDAILERAPDHPAWHRPLVYRPALTGSAMRTLSRFVAAGLIEAMRSRSDIDPDTADALTEMLRTRLTSESHPLDRGPPLDVVKPVGSAAKSAPDPNTARHRAADLHARGVLSSQDIDDAIFDGDRPFVAAALALLAEVPHHAVQAVLDTRSPKGIVALCWKAGLPVGIAIKVQTHIARVQPSAVLHARNGTDYPMPVADLRRQLAFFGIE
ncbi:DUF2336 domain-containing protein [Fodinicurvata sp. EGI_FJ10296]|uniref:DUF2336 domain-containing protein n=1 Tax=Fodinicurvata sp. EGI_FJ10296 TaxID=3231908 RepID=UPI003455DABA